MLQGKRHLYFSVLISSITAICSAVFLSCSAYFNTLYNAETAFREAQTIHKKVLQNYPDSIVVSPPFDAASKYDRTIEKSIKAIETFPKAKKRHDDALLLIGKAHFYKKEMSKAIRRFRQLEQEFPGSELLPEACIYLAKAYIEEGNLDKAEETLISAEKRFPELNNDYKITMLLIMIAIRRGGRSQAIELLERSIKSIKSENLRIDMMLRTAELYMDLKQYQKAIVILKKTPRRKDLPLQSYRTDKAFFVCLKEIDSLQPAYNHLLKMIEKKQYDVYMDEMLFEQGRLLHIMGKTDEAIKVFKKLTAGIDSTSAGADTSSFKARALLELALIYQKNKEDYKSAGSYFKLASMTRDTATSRFAGARLSAMERLKKLRDEKDTKDSLRSIRLFSIGELFRFELDEPDSAYLQFVKISTDTTADTALIPKALCQAALIVRDELHDTVRCDSLLRLIIASYPATEYGKIAQQEMKMPVTIKTRTDSAHEAFVRAEKLYYNENDVKGAVRAFFEISKQYPELPIAPKSLFAAAWITDNVLLKKQTAKTLYEKICAKYQKTVYCTEQSKPRLKIVADTLEKLEKLRKENEEKKSIKKDTKKSVQKKASDIREDVGGQPEGADGISELLTKEEINEDSAHAGTSQPSTNTGTTRPAVTEDSGDNVPTFSPNVDSAGITE